MDASLYKTHTTTRSLTYSYFHSLAQPNHRTLLLLHGYPLTSSSWHLQVPYFTSKGYGVFAPDLLGYGGSDKPGLEELEKYSPSGIAQDLIDILDHEKVGRVVSIGHDWGALTNSRIAQLYPERFDAFGFLIVGYVPPNPNMNVQVVNAMLKQVLGFEIFGYQMMHAEPDAAKLIESHWDSYFSLIFAADPQIWKEHLGPVGALRAWLEADRKAEVAGYLTEADKLRITDALLGEGRSLKGPLLWYTHAVRGLTAAEDKTIPKDKYVITKPVFTASGRRDPFCAASFMLMKSDAACTNVTFKEYSGDHWIQWQYAEELNRDLGGWLEGLPE